MQSKRDASTDTKTRYRSKSLGRAGGEIEEKES